MAPEPFWSRYILYDYSFSDFSRVTYVVDVGCGRGAQLEQVVGRGCRVIGVDLDGEALAVCAKQGRAVLRAECAGDLGEGEWGSCCSDRLASGPTARTLNGCLPQGPKPS